MPGRAPVARTTARASIGPTRPVVEADDQPVAAAVHADDVVVSRTSRALAGYSAAVRSRLST